MLHLKEIFVRMDKKELFLLPLVKWHGTKEILMVYRQIEVAITDLLMHWYLHRQFRKIKEFDIIQVDQPNTESYSKI